LPSLCVTPLLTSEIGEAQSYLHVNRHIVGNTAAVDYLGLCIIAAASRPQGQKGGILGLHSAQSGCSAALPSGSHPRIRIVTSGVANERECGKMAIGSKGRPR
jgi:hypothetical protein